MSVNHACYSIVNSDSIYRSVFVVVAVRGGRRAVVLFLDNSHSFVGQMNWLLESWRFSGAKDTKEGTTDVFILVTPQSRHLVNSTWHCGCVFL